MRTDERVVGFIKAMTAYGGDSYAEYEPFWNDQNAALFQAWMTEQPKANGVTLYRGYTFNQTYFDDACLEVGSEVGVDVFTQEFLPSFTTGILRAVRYINDYGDVGLEDSVRVLFVVQTRGKAFVDIASLSRYPEEDEYKCLDDVRLRVVSIDQMAGCYLQITLEEV